jgi:iron complex outermembrane recepter protein
MRMRGRNALRVAVSALLLSAAGVAPAQQVEVQRLEEIIVTAQKREERLRDVPQSVTALAEQSLERLQVNDFSDYVTRVPGLTADTSQPGSTRLTLRGLNAGGVASTIGTYVDETPFGSSSGLANGAVLAPDLDPFDVERIEVLRGPQGTLYGASTLGGLLKFVTRAPSPEELEFRVQATGESTEDGDETWGARALANVPLGSKAAVRVSGWTRSQGGFIDDPGRGVEDVNGVDTTGGRGSLLVEATDDVSIRLSATVQDIESEAQNTANYFPEPFAPVAGDFDQFRGFPEKNDVTYDIYNGTIDWDLGWASLLSSTSYGELDQDNVQEATVALGGLLSHLANEMTQEKFTQELRLASPETKQLEWLVGLFYTDEDANLFQQVFIGPPPGTPPPAITIGLDSEYEEKAAFGTITYYFSEQFDVAAGVRYSENEQTAVQSSDFTAIGTQDSDDSVTTYSLAPRWRVSDDTMVYARVATGYRPGGPNVLSTLGSGIIPPQYDADEATNYELGIKTDLFEGVLRLDAAVYFIDWEDIQLLITDPVAQISGNGNGGTAETQGVEWAATWLPSDRLTIRWTGAYLDAELTSDTDPIVGGSDGDPLPFAPEWTTAIDVDYEWDVFTDATAYVGGGWRFVDELATDFDLQVELPSYDVIDLRAGVDFERFSVELFAKNVTDEYALVSFGGFPITPQMTPGLFNGAAAVLRPRTIGLVLSARF